MNAENANLVALTAHGNAFLLANDEEALSIGEKNTAFEDTQQVQFSRHVDKHDEDGQIVAETPADWLQMLRREGVSRLSYAVFAWNDPTMPEHHAVSFANGVPVAIQANLPDGFELWYPKWTIDRTDSSRRWLVRYRALRFADDKTVEIGAEPTRAWLSETLAEAANFAHANFTGGEPWEQFFNEALVLLNSPAPTFEYYKDLLPAMGYGLQARQILACVVKAYVFGGMGSWNDTSFRDESTQSLYVRISEKLYSGIKSGTVCATNSFAWP